MVNTLLVFPEFNRPNMVCTPFATLPANIGICSQEVLRTAESLHVSNQKLRALTLLINAALLYLVLIITSYCGHNVYNNFLVSTLS